MEDIRISLFQADLAWEAPKENFEKFEALFEQISETDIIFLPEMFNTGFSMRSSVLAESMDGKSVQWMKKQAQKRNAVICGSIIVQVDGQYLNRQLWVEPNGEIQSYDKRHLFRMAGENEYFSPGEQRLIVEYKGWKIMPLICYDLRFPVWSRNRFKTDRKNYANAEYDLLLYNANWPESRVAAWEKLLAARAIENQSYVVGVNRVGEDGKEIAYSGGSQVLNAKGEIMWRAQDHQIAVKTVTLQAADLKNFREKFPVGMDADKL